MHQPAPKQRPAQPPRCTAHRSPKRAALSVASDLAICTTLYDSITTNGQPRELPVPQNAAPRPVETIRGRSNRPALFKHCRQHPCRPTGLLCRHCCPHQRRTSRYHSHSVAFSAGWLARQAGPLPGWLIGCLASKWVGWEAHWLASGLLGWLPGSRQAGGSLAAWLAGWQGGWQAGSLASRPAAGWWAGWLPAGLTTWLGLAGWLTVGLVR